MGPVEALKIALSREEDSIAVYQKFSVEHQELKEMFFLLINEEEKHKKMIEKKIVELTKF
jgi:rubrerythrin